MYVTFTGSIVATGANRAVAANGSGNVVELAGPINISDSATDRTLTLTGTSNMKVSGVIANGGTSTAGRLTKAGTPSTVVLTANNTYAGKTTITGGTLVVSSLNSVVGGTASSNLGAPKNVADGTIPIGAAQNSGSLRYIGPGETTDRVIDLAGTSGGATIDSSGDGPLAFTSAFTATGADSKTLTLQGTNAGDNTVAGAIVNNSATNKTSLVKSGTGKWILSGASSYSGGTTISDGTLVVSGGTGTLGLGHVTVQSTVDSKLQILSGVANAIGDTATLNLVGGGSPDVADQGYVDLGGGIQERVGLVQLNGIAQPRGLSYGSTASGAMIQLDEYFAGAGLVTAGILGDFNGNNTVDTGDFVVWRKNPAVYGGSAGYDLWRVNLGATSSASGSELAGDVGSVPEPSSFLLALSALFAAGRRRHRCKSGSTDRGTEQDDSGRNCGR